MASAALESWNTERSVRLDEIEAAHQAVGGTGRGRRFATLQINHAYTVILTSQFQGFCRDIHTEAADALANSIDPRLRNLVFRRLTQGRKLDRGNPNPGHLGADFGRFEVELWPELLSSHRFNRNRQDHLSKLCQWRNAIAHQDFSSVGSDNLRLAKVKEWRSACNHLAREIDALLYTSVDKMTGSAPWS